MITSKNTSSQIPKHDPKPWKTHSTIFDLWLTTEFLTLLTLWTTPTFPSHPFPWAADTTSTATSAKDVTLKRFRARSFSECGFPGGSSRALCWAGMMFPGKVYQLISIDNKVCHLYMFGIFCSRYLLISNTTLRNMTATNSCNINHYIIISHISPRRKHATDWCDSGRCTNRTHIILLSLFPRWCGTMQDQVTVIWSVAKVANLRRQIQRLIANQR